MKHISAGIKIGILVLIGFVVAYGTWKTVGEGGGGGFLLWCHFKDAQGLAAKSRVVIAGLPVGAISDRKLEGRFARVTVDIAKGTEIWSNAAIYKKSSSLLGEYYLEIDPGTPEMVTPHGEVVKTHLLKHGDEIKNVFEAASTDDLIRRVNETIPQVDKTLGEIEGLASDVRKLINGPVANMAENLDEAVEQDAELVHSILLRIDRIATDVSKVTQGSDQQVGRILDNVERVSADLKELVKVTQGEIQLTGTAVREKLEKIDGALAQIEQTFSNTSSISEKIDKDEGTLGKLINDPTIGENVESITTDIAGFVKTAFGLQTYVGIRTEYNFTSSLFKTYFSLELQPRADKYYLIEIVDDPRGSPSETLVFNAGGPGTADDSFTRMTVIESPLRFTFQFAKILGDLTVRIGIKESTGGLGLDYKLPFDGKLYLDVFDTSFDRLPRLKVWAAYQFWKYLYLYGGIDDALNDSVTVPIAPNTIADENYEYHYGRDYFAGLMLRFNDVDLAALLFIGGSALAGAASN
jgi:phospholipid/cholesterol/gamma-HCH transport system substrate-binding protein